jgi:outer membrane protein
MRSSLRQILSTAVGVAALIGAFAAPVAAETLPEVIGLAYQSNPTLLSQRAQLRALEETYSQARSGIRPSVSLGASNRDSDTQGGQGYSYNSANITASQALFTGGRTANALRVAEAQILSARAGLRRTEASVMQTVIQAYIDVRRDMESLTIRQENVAVLRRQLEEANARFEVGEITKTDVNQAAARYAGAQAQLAAAQSQLATSRAAYSAAVGQAPGDLAPEPELSQIPATVDEAFALAERNSPVLLQADYAEQASRARIAAAKSELMPTVSLQAQLAFTDQASVQLGRGSGNYDRNLTTSAVVSQPLFTAGVNGSRIRQAVETNVSDRLQMDVARRSVVQSVSQAWGQLLATRSAITANEEQVRATTVAFEGTKQENQVGLRTTLDVLNAEQELRNAQLSLVNARRDSYLAGALLLNAMGALEARNLSAGITVYDAEGRFNEIKSGWTATPWDKVVEAIDGIGSRKIESRQPASDAPMATAQPSGGR